MLFMLYKNHAARRVVNSLVIGLSPLVAAMPGCDRRNDTAAASSSGQTQREPNRGIGVAGAATIPLGQGAAGAVAFIDPPDAEIGREIYVQSCATCHGFQAQGLPHQGLPLRTSPFVAAHSDQDLIAFIKAGRSVKDPANTSGVAMPPRGNNPGLNDARLADVVAYLRQVQQEARADAQANSATADTGGAAIK